MEKQLVEAVLQERPALHTIFNEKNVTLTDYITDRINTVEKRTSSRIINLVADQAMAFLTDVSREQIIAQLRQFPMVSTADHGSILNFPLLINSNLMLALIMRTLVQPYVISLFTSRISLGNIAYPRGFYFQNRRFNIFSKKDANKILYSFDKGLSEDSLLRLKAAKVPDFIIDIFDRRLGISQLKSAGRLVNQLPYLNNRLWPLLFNAEARASVPKLIYLCSDDIVKQLIIEDLRNSSSLLSLILFEKELRESFISKFRNIYGSWSENSGLQVFWHINDTGKLIPLKLLDDELISTNGWQLALEKDAIIQSLNSGKIIPSLLLDMFMLSFSEGLFLFGGFNQIEYGTQMGAAFTEFFQAHGMDPWIERIESSIPNGLICGPMPFGNRSSFDMIWEANSIGGKGPFSYERGFTLTDLDAIGSMKMSNLVLSGIETIAQIV